MVTGEGVSINRKNKRSYVTPNWTAHLAIAGNAKPSWEDLGFALVRRLMPIYMHREVHIKDTLLIERVMADTMDAIIFKFAVAYLDASKMYRTRDLWSKDPYYNDGRRILPKTLIEFNSTIKTSMNPLFCLLESGLGSCEKPMVLDPQGRVYITLTSFVDQYNAYCRVRFPSMKRQNFSPDIYTPVFAKFGLRVEHNVTKRFDSGDGRGERHTTATFIVGVGFVDMFPAEAAQIMGVANIGGDADEDDDYLGAIGAVPAGGIGGDGEDEDEGGAGGGGGAPAAAAQFVLPTGRNPWEVFIEALRTQNGADAQINRQQMEQLFALTAHSFHWSTILQLMRQASGRPDAALTTEMIAVLKSKFRHR